MRVHHLLEIKCVGLESGHGGERVGDNWFSGGIGCLAFISCGEFGSVGFVYGG